tara:strand:- start:206 stop:520 length:315 start_codon:yes stop_codon:yes gene_type:complete
MELDRTDREMTQMHVQSPPEGRGLEFPCEFPIKAMGLAEPELDAVVVAIVRRHVPILSDRAVRSRTSRQGKYQSITVTIKAESQAQLDAIYRELSAHQKISIVL